MTGKTKPAAARKPRFGALFWVALLLVSSALLRLGIDAGPALAREAAEDAVASDSGGQAPVPAAVPAGPEGLQQLMRALQSREAALKQRERQFEDRMKALEIANAAIDSKMAALAEAERSLSDTLAMADGASEEDLARLTSVYEKMKPKESAALFETMDPAFAAGFLGRMRPDSAAGILARLSPQAAYSISVILAGRNARVPKR